MAKNTQSSSFRKIDVDQLDEDVFCEDNGAGPCDGGAAADLTQVTQLLNSGRSQEALQHLLAAGGDGQQVLTAMLRVLASFRTGAEMEAAVGALQPEQVDLLMKYVYRGFQTPPESGTAHLLTWHEKLYNAGGLGCIVRVLTDRRRI